MLKRDHAEDPRNSIPITLRFKDSKEERARFYFYTLPRKEKKVPLTENDVFLPRRQA